MSKDRMSLRYTNEYGDTIYLGEERPFIYLSHSGLDSMNAKQSLIKSPYQIGKTSLGNDIDERPFTIKFALISDTDEEQEKLREEVLRAFSPIAKGSLKLYGVTFKREFGVCEVKTTPKFKDDDYTTFNHILECQVSLVSPDALLVDLFDTEFQLSQVVPMIEFPFEVEVGQTFEVGQLNKGGVEYVNDGNAPAPIQVEIFGPVKTPKVTNLTTGEFILVNTPIMANERMVIDTTFTSKKVVIIDDTGVERNAFHYIDLDTTFFQLNVGVNKLEFDAEEGNDTATIKVFLRRRWTGV